jgi:prevent-host-death family protein
MIVNATEFKNKVGKYIEIAEKEDVIITRNGKFKAKLVSFKQNETPIADSLVGILKDKSTIDVAIERDERLAKYDSLS